MFFNPAFGQEWMRRMIMLGYVDDNRLDETYNALKEPDFEKIKAELAPIFNSIYVVVPPGKSLAYTEAYADKGFKVYRVK